jgi:hypothetical protein
MPFGECGEIIRKIILQEIEIMYSSVYLILWGDFMYVGAIII